MRTTRRILVFATLLVGLLLLAAPGTPAAQLAVAITIGPPPLPVYVQPVCPGEGLIWMPGYWAYGPDGYFWVPGMWVQPPEVGYLWTPGYWAWDDGVYVWNAGYWGPTVGFYGGIDYGFGYFGTGYTGGYWDHDRFYYNTEVNNVNVTVVHYTYTRPLVNRTTVTYISYNGGPGGIEARPTAREQAVIRVSHKPPTPAQMHQEQAARGDRMLLASVNHGKPRIAATPKAGDFRSSGVVAARAAGGAVPSRERPKATPERRQPNRPVVPRGEPAPRPDNKRSPRTRQGTPPANANPQPERDRQIEMRRQQEQKRQQMEQRHRQEQQKSQQRSNQRQQEIQRQQQQRKQRQNREEQQRQKQEKNGRPARPSEHDHPPSQFR